MSKTSIYLNKPIQQDDIFPANRIQPLELLTGMPTRRGLQNAVISNGEIVNVVSNSYGHLRNEDYFIEVERNLIEADISFISRTINRDNRTFCADYILNDDRYIINLQNGKDIIQPMLRFVNAYDGSCKTTGHFGFFRQVCSNGLHVAHSKIGFSLKHRGSIQKIVLPEIKHLVDKFMDNEYYSLHKKFEILANTPIKDVEAFVKTTAEELKLFKYEASDKNPKPSVNARLVVDIINREKSLLNEQNATLWLGYNALNELVHGKLKKTFEQQQTMDNRIFEYVLSL